MGKLTTHVLDTARGCPAAGLAVTLHKDGRKLAAGVTDADGRISDLLPPQPIEPGEYVLEFDTGVYTAANGDATFYPRAVIHFTVRTGDEHYHVPLLLSPFGYSTYRGS